MRGIPLRIFFFAFIITILFPSIVSAERLGVVRWEQAQRYRFYGLIDLSYRDYTQETNAGKWEEKCFQQTYSLGLSGYVWRPRLMIFSADISFTQSKYKGSLDIKTIGYGLNAVIFPRTHFPIIIYANRSTSDLSGYLGGLNKITSNNYGLRWSYARPGYPRLMLSYGHSDIKYGDGIEESYNSYIIDLSGYPGRNSKLKITWNLNYELITHTDNISGESEKTHTIRFWASRPFTSHLWLYNDMTFYKTEDTKSYYLGLSAFYSQPKLYSVNTYRYSLNKSLYNETTTHNLNSYSTYWYRKNLSFSGNLDFNRTAQDGLTSQSYGASVGSNYYKQYKKFFLSAGGGIGFSSSETEKSYTASYGFSLSTVPKITRLFTYRGVFEYRGDYRSEGGRSDNLRLELNAFRSMNRLTVSGTSTLSYFISSPKGYPSTNGFALSLSAAAYMRLNTFTMLRGTADYTTSHSNGSVYNSLILTEGINFILYRRLNLNIAARQTMTKSDESRYTSNEILSSIDYSLRRLFFHAEYNMSTDDSDGTILKKRTIFFRITRPFGRGR